MCKHSRLCVVISGLGALGVGLAAPMPPSLIVSQSVQASDGRHGAASPLHQHASSNDQSLIVSSPPPRRSLATANIVSVLAPTIRN